MLLDTQVQGSVQWVLLEISSTLRNCRMFAWLSADPTHAGSLWYLGGTFPKRPAGNDGGYSWRIIPVSKWLVAPIYK